MNAQEELLHWVKERESIRIKKERGDFKPWTTDSILRSYKFCNVHRNDDRVSVWIHNNWLHPYSGHPRIAFAMCVARIFNWPETLEAIQDLVFGQWDSSEVKERLKYRRDKQGCKIFTGAYTVSTCGRAMDKIDYCVDLVFNPLLKTIKNPVEGQTLEEYWKDICQYQGFSSFMAGQVIADLKYILPLLLANDWNTFAPLGPGSTRGLNRYAGRELSFRLKQDQGTKELLQIQSVIRDNLGMEVALHNVQNVMCEFDKYVRIKYDGGTVRSKYNGRF